AMPKPAGGVAWVLSARRSKLGSDGVESGGVERDRSKSEIQNPKSEIRKLMTNDFTGRVALVTGGSRGIGRATALQLAHEGAHVAISYASRPEPARETLQQIEACGRKGLAVPCDVARQEQVDHLVAQTRARLGPIDLLVHCGAISNTCSH